MHYYFINSSQNRIKICAGIVQNTSLPRTKPLEGTIYYKYDSILLFQRAQVSGCSLERKSTASFFILSGYISMLPCCVHLTSRFLEHSAMYCMNKACNTGLTARMKQEAAFLNEGFTTAGNDWSAEHTHIDLHQYSRLYAVFLMQMCWCPYRNLN